MDRFSFSGLWLHAGSTLIAAGLSSGDAVLTYLNAVQLPTWAHLLVGAASFALAFYRGAPKAA